MIPSNGSVRPSRNSDEDEPPADDAQLAESEAGHRRDHDRDRNRAEHDQHARLEDRAHVGHVEGIDEVAPMRMGGPIEPARVGPGLVEGRGEQACERQQRPADQDRGAAPSRSASRTWGRSRPVSSVHEPLDRQHADQHQHHQDDGERRCEPDLAVVERELVDLEPGHHRRVRQGRRWSRCRRCRTPTRRRPS